MSIIAEREQTASPHSLEHHTKRISPSICKKKVEWKGMSGQSDCAMVFGKVVHSDGSHYVGSLVRGVPHGRGRFVFKNGGEYAGEFVRGKKHGNGILSYGDGSVYVGLFRRGLKHGLGIMRFADASTYEGDFLHGTMEGLGKFTRPSGYAYSGFWMAGQRHGEGSMLLPDGTVASTSNWINGLREPQQSRCCSRAGSPQTVALPFERSECTFGELQRSTVAMGREMALSDEDGEASASE